MRYVTLGEYLAIAERVTAVPADLLEKSARIDLADSALHAPAAGFGDQDFYPDPTDKAAVLCARLVANHPLPDGNKRAAWETMRMFIALNGGECLAPSAHLVEYAIVALAAHKMDEDGFADWLRPCVTWPQVEQLD